VTLSPSPRDSASAALAPFWPLRPAERLLVQAWASGTLARVGLRRPEGPSAEHSIRAPLLSWMVRGGLPVRCRRLQVVGASIEGRFDLGDAAYDGHLWFYRCRFDSPVVLEGARISGSVTLAACRLVALQADGCRIGGDLVLAAGAAVPHELQLSRAHIGGRFDASRLDLTGSGAADPARRALVADAVRVGGDVLLRDGFQAVGEVRLVGALVGGDVRAGGLFNGAPVADGGRGPALVLDRAQVQGSLVFEPSFGAAGAVHLRRTRIGGDLDATGASFDWLGDALWQRGWGRHADGTLAANATLVLDRSHIEGALVLRELRAPLVAASFAGTKAGTLSDDHTTWGEHLWLDGFQYSRLDDEAPMDTRFRVDWLRRQSPAHLGAQFRTQPWRRLIRALQRQGRGRSASRVAVQRERWLRHSGQVGQGRSAPWRSAARAAHAAWGALAGYGHQPWRLAGWLAAAWLTGGAAYGAGAALGALDPVRAPPLFDPMAHSLGRLLPVLPIDTGTPWAAGSALGLLMRWCGYLQSVFAGMLLLLWIGAMARWGDRDGVNAP
jgi:hypothetical protein